ncbi:MAG: hypothetical protein JO249_26180 [Acidobacteria bacterium]|nr:hypothetical protein [Acidobacteriota bacterium]MBV9484211.1 hypothetical protein [Acidobacteriota bacterium]
MPDVSPTTIRQEELLLRQQRRGGTLKTVGKILLWMDLIFVCFVYVGLESGSHLYWWWFMVEFILGAALMAYGTRLRSEASRRLAELSPTVGTPDLDHEAEQQPRAS